MTSKNKNLSEYNKKDINKTLTGKFAIVVSQWNEEITDALLQGALQTLKENGIKKTNIIIEYVPGSFELPLAAQLILESTDVDAVICLGCVIQGETRHFEFISQAVSQGIKDVSLEYNSPVIFGVLTTDNLKQAQERAGGKLGNKGVEAAYTALKMFALKNKLNT